MPDRICDPVRVQASNAFRVRVSRQDRAEPVEAVTETPLSGPEWNHTTRRCFQINRDKVQVRIMAGRAVVLRGLTQAGRSVFIFMVCVVSIEVMIVTVVVMWARHTRILRMCPRMLHRHQDT